MKVQLKYNMDFNFNKLFGSCLMICQAKLYNVIINRVFTPIFLN